jgi:ABC-2 type transport system permease protein
MLSSVINDPNGPVAFWGSMIPFSSPIIMMGRVPFGIPGTVPWWELILSMAILVASFIFSVWLSGKIYRTGILMYGKKPTWKEMIKWVFRKN